MAKRDEQLMEVRGRHMVIDFLHETMTEQRKSTYVLEQIALRYYLSELHSYRVICAFKAANTFEAAMDLFSKWAKVGVMDVFQIFVQEGLENWEVAVVASGYILWVEEQLASYDEAAKAGVAWVEEQLAMMRSRLAIITEDFPTSRQQ